MAKAQVTVPLDIADVRVLQTEINERGELIITIASTKVGTQCRRCGRQITKAHGQDEWVTVRHLPVFGRPTYLHYRPKRYQCLDCEGQPTTSQTLDWRDTNSLQSMAYDEHILMQLVNSTIEDVSVKEQLGYDSVLGVLERCIHAEVDWSEYSELGILGLDEIALKKGHRDYVTIVTARLAGGRVVILGVLEGRQKETVAGFLRSIPISLLGTIHTACCDLWEGYTEALREEVPGAKIVIDRFHVAKHYREAADRVRKQELARLKSELSKEDYQQLKGSLWAFRKNPENLTSEDRQVLQCFFSYSPDAQQAYDLREQLTAIFEQLIPKQKAKARIRNWIRRVRSSGLTCFNDFLNLLEQWLGEITNYFINRESSGFVEGFNNRLKVLKRRCYGLFNLKHIFQRIYLDLEGYRLFAG
jgi:transposase